MTADKRKAALEALNRAWVDAELVMDKSFEHYYATIRAALSAPQPTTGKLDTLADVTAYARKREGCGSTRLNDHVISRLCDAAELSAPPQEVVTDKELWAACKKAGRYEYPREYIHTIEVLRAAGYRITRG